MFQIIDGAGHHVYVDKVEDFNTLVAEVGEKVDNGQDVALIDWFFSFFGLWSLVIFERFSFLYFFFFILVTEVGKKVSGSWWGRKVDNGQAQDVALIDYFCILFNLCRLDIDFWKFFVFM